MKKYQKSHRLKGVSLLNCHGLKPVSISFELPRVLTRGKVCRENVDPEGVQQKSVLF